MYSKLNYNINILFGVRSLNRVVELINVCAALHNICSIRNVLHPEPETNNSQHHGLQVPPPGNNSSITEPKRICDSIRDDFYTNYLFKSNSAKLC